MPQLHNAYVDGVPANPALAAETILLTLPPSISLPQGVQVVLEGMVQLQAGTATTSVVIRCRRGAALTGALVGAALTHTLAAGANACIAFQFSDTPGEVAGQQYVVTAQQTAATGNGTGVWCSLQATWNS